MRLSSSPVACLLVAAVLLRCSSPQLSTTAPEARPELPSASGWQSQPAVLARIERIPDADLRKLVHYGKELFIHTAHYLGPKGKVAHNTSRMNCQNCHLDAGLKKFGNDLTQASVRYPMYRAREGRILSLKERINNCVERPMSGTALPIEGREMKAIHAYISWLNTLPVASTFKSGENLMPVSYPGRAASPKRGAKIYAQQCARCHGSNGEGMLHADNISFAYPPLWGPESFSSGSSMTRVTKLAAFIKGNMPYGITWENPLLSDNEALDVAAFISDPVTHPRPIVWDISQDYKNIMEKPIDLAFGPYIDPFSEKQHWLGPFGPIDAFYKQRKLEANRKSAPDKVSRKPKTSNGMKQDIL